MKLTERSTSICLALGRLPRRTTVRYQPIWRLRTSRTSPQTSGAGILTAASLRSFGGHRLTRTTDRPADDDPRPAGRASLGSTSRGESALQRGLAREHRCDSTFDGLVQNHRSQVCPETFRGTWSDLRKHQRAPRRTSSMASCGGTNPVISPPHDSPHRPTAGLDGARTTTAGM